MTLLQQVLAEASEDVAESNGDLEGLDDVNLKAQMAFRALKLSEAKRRAYRSVQASIVVQMVREPGGPLWLAHPPTDEYPGGFGSLKEFLKATGIGYSTVFDLNNLGTRIVPYCDEHNISIEPYLTEGRYPMLVEASSQLRRAIDEDESSEYEVDEILDDVMRARTREDVRAKYRRHREDRVGEAAVHYLDDDRAVLIVVLSHYEDAGVLVSKLSGTVGWDSLVMTLRQKARSIQVVVNDPKAGRPAS